MKYLKNFNDLIKESNNGEDFDLKTVIKSMRKIFKTKDVLSQVWGNDTLQISTDVYDALIDVQELLELPEDEIQVFADNLGVGAEENIITAIIEEMYSEKFKRDFTDDIGLCISTLKEFIKNKKGSEDIIKSAETYLVELQKIKDNL